MIAERFDHFMAGANAAYYATHDFSADFTTAPELTQVFGELLGAWAKTVWTMMGEPADVMLVEAGPGGHSLDAARGHERSGSGWALAALAAGAAGALGAHVAAASAPLPATASPSAEQDTATQEAQPAA